MHNSPILKFIWWLIGQLVAEPVMLAALWGHSGAHIWSFCFNGKTHYTQSLSIPMFNYQRVKYVALRLFWSPWHPMASHDIRPGWVSILPSAHVRKRNAGAMAFTSFTSPGSPGPWRPWPSTAPLALAARACNGGGLRYLKLNWPRGTN